VVHCPTSNMKLASGATMPLPELLGEGIEVMLGTDSPASNNSLNMMTEMKFAALAHKAHRWDAGVMNHRVVLDMASTWNKSMLKHADAITVRKTDVSIMPWHDFGANIVYSGAHVEDVFINGKPAMLDGKMLVMDEDQVLDEFERTAEKFRAVFAEEAGENESRGHVFWWQGFQLRAFLGVEPRLGSNKSHNNVFRK
ncbi:MAG: hypothetical protein DRN20_05745, partial [Thermoplasmata archaeon]